MDTGETLASEDSHMNEVNVGHHQVDIHRENDSFVEVREIVYVGSRLAADRPGSHWQGFDLACDRCFLFALVSVTAAERQCFW
jgi:hypothetical protein